MEALRASRPVAAATGISRHARARSFASTSTCMSASTSASVPGAGALSSSTASARLGKGTTRANARGRDLPRETVAGAGPLGSRSGGGVSARRRPHHGGAGGRRGGRGGLGVARTTVTTAGLKKMGPTTPTPTYSSTWLDRQLLKLLSRRVAVVLGDDPDTATGDYDDTMRRCVKLVSSARSAAEAQRRGERVLRSLMPPGFPFVFKWFIAILPGWFAARHAATVTPLLLPWFVGPGHVIDAPFDLPVDDDARPPANVLAAALTDFRRASPGVSPGHGVSSVNGIATHEISLETSAASAATAAASTSTTVDDAASAAAASAAWEAQHSAGFTALFGSKGKRSSIATHDISLETSAVSAATASASISTTAIDAASATAASADWDAQHSAGFAGLFGVNGESPGYRQGVLLERCRVLEEGGCASVCLNVCKLPTQQFFNEVVGLPVTLEPNYETFECRFVYGKTPPPPELDKAFNTPCFSQCPITKMGGGGATASAEAVAGAGGGGAFSSAVGSRGRASSVGGDRGRVGEGGSALGEVPRWLASEPAAVAASTDEGEDALGASNCSRLPTYKGDDQAVVRRNHPGGKG